MPVKIVQAIQRYAIPSRQVRLFSNVVADHLLATGGAAARVAIQFNMQPQVQTQWCWAATSTSVSHYYHNNSQWTQCNVAEAVLADTCCTRPGPCNKPWLLNEALTITGNFDHYSGTLQFSAIETELRAGRVVCCRVGWRGGGGHFVAIYACETVGGINYYDIDDPISGKTHITEKGFMTSYQGSGSWTHTFITKP